MLAVPGPHLLYTNRVNTSWHLYPVYKQMFLSGPVTHVASAGLLASAESRQVSWGRDGQMAGGLFCFLGWRLSLSNLSESRSLQVHIARLKVINCPSHHAA